MRRITSKDKPTILKYAPIFWKEIKGEELAGELDLNNISNFLDSCFLKDVLIGWIYEKDNEIHGGILFILTPELFTNKTILKELFWFVAPEKRNSWVAYKLIKEAEKFAKENGVHIVSMNHMRYPNPENLKHFYEKIGYNMTQVEYFKKIS